VISTASLTFITDGVPLFGTDPLNRGSYDLVIAYRNVTSAGSEHLSSLSGPFLHIGDLRTAGPDFESL
jgi:hypothetical protein